MSTDLILWCIGILLFILFSIVKNKRLKWLCFGLGCIILFMPSLVLKLFGRLNSIKKIEGQTIDFILLRPSEPDWAVNLTDSIFKITDLNQIQKIRKLLEHSEVFTPNHPGRIWETELIIVTREKDSMLLTVKKNDNSTSIRGPNEVLRNDELTTYLEKITNFRIPKMAKRKN